jgi:predicted MFS family arabinose efflux permease
MMDAAIGGSKSVSAWFRDDRLGLAMGICQAGLPMGGAAAAAALPYVAIEFGWRSAFLLCAAVALGGGLAFGVVYRTPARSEQRRRKPATVSSMIAIMREPWMRKVILSGAALVTAQYAVLPFLMLFLRDSHSIPLAEAGWLLFTVQLFGMIGRVALVATSSADGVSSGKSARRISPRAVAAWLGFFGLGWYGPWVVHVTEISQPENVGLALGAAMASNQIFIVAAPPLLGLLHDMTGSYLAIWYLTAAFLIAAGWRMGRSR